MLTQSTLERTKYWPEIIPDTTLYASISQTAMGSPSPADVRVLNEKFQVKLNGLIVKASNDIELECKTDKTSQRMLLAGLDSGYVPCGFAAKDSLALNVFNVGSQPITDYHIAALWMVTKPTVAEKLLRKWTLTPEEKAIAEELDIYALVEKGIRPVTWEYMKDREYQVLEERVFSSELTFTVDNEYTLLDLKTNSPDEFWVLEDIYCSDSDAANDVTLRLKRDGDNDYVMLRTAALAPDNHVGCWIPALDELIVTGSSKAASVTVKTRFKAKKMRLTNILRARWGLVKSNQLPADVMKKVIGGIL